MRNLVRKKNSNSLAENRKARHDYFVEETIEAGLALVGTEVKSIRNGKCNLKDTQNQFLSSLNAKKNGLKTQNNIKIKFTFLLLMV